jgi:hypothetical protein
MKIQILLTIIAYILSTRWLPFMSIGGLSEGVWQRCKTSLTRVAITSERMISPFETPCIMW